MCCNEKDQVISSKVLKFMSSSYCMCDAWGTKVNSCLRENRYIYKEVLAYSSEYYSKQSWKILLQIYQTSALYRKFKWEVFMFE